MVDDSEVQMTRRISVLALVAVGALGVLRAQNSVTFIMTNGERVSGAIASSSAPSSGMP